MWRFSDLFFDKCGDKAIFSSINVEIRRSHPKISTCFKSNEDYEITNSLNGDLATERHVPLVKIKKGVLGVI